MPDRPHHQPIGSWVEFKFKVSRCIGSCELRARLKAGSGKSIAPNIRHPTAQLGLLSIQQMAKDQQKKDKHSLF